MNVPPGVIIEDGVLKNCPKGIEVHFDVPDGVKEIGRESFAGCASLASIHIPEGCTHIGDWAFWACKALTNVRMPDSCEEIGTEAFGRCENLRAALVPETCNVGVYAFPDSCRIFDNIADYRRHLAGNLAEERASDGVEIVGMHAPQPEPSVDYRGGRDI